MGIFVKKMFGVRLLNFLSFKSCGSVFGQVLLIIKRTADAGRMPQDLLAAKKAAIKGCICFGC